MAYSHNLDRDIGVGAFRRSGAPIQTEGAEAGQTPLCRTTCRPQERYSYGTADYTSSSLAHSNTWCSRMWVEGSIPSARTSADSLKLP